MRRFALFLLLALSLAIAGCHARSPEPDWNVVTAQGSLSNRFVLADKSTPIIARLLIETKATERTARPPVNLALVIDTSGSMEGRAIEDARAASHALLASLLPKDRIAVVAFGSTTEVIQPSLPLADADLKKLHARIDGMRALGTTDMAGGLRAGLAEVSEHFVVDGVNRVILLGDGDPNVADPVKDMARDAGARGISITALGLGPDYNETLMGAVAQASGGIFHYVADSTKVAAFFRTEITRLNRTFAKNATVELVPGPGVHITSIVGQGGARGLHVPIGDLSFGEQREIWVKLDAPAHHAGAAVELLDAVLRFDDMKTETPVERRIFFGAHATSKTEEIEAGRSTSVEQAAAKAEAAAATLEAIDAARRGSMDSAQKSLKKAQDFGYEFSDDLVNALPSVSPNSGQVSNPSAKRSNEVVRRAHDDAMKTFQAH